MKQHCLSRRRFLHATATAGAALLTAGSSVSAARELEANRARVDFCFSLYGMRSLTLPDALNACADVGYDGVELDCNREQSGDPDQLSTATRRDIRKQLVDRGLTLPALMVNLPLVTNEKRHRQNLDRLQTVGQLGHDLSPEASPLIETVLGSRSNRWNQVKDKMVTALEDWAKAGEASQTVIAVKAHVGGALHTPQDAKWLVERVDSRWIKLDYDFSHFQLGDFDLVESLELLIDKTVFIHVKDSKGKLGKFQFLLPGEGDIDYLTYFRLLQKAGYRGAVCVEVSGQIHGKPGYDPVAAAKTSYANLAPVFAKAGLRR